MAKPEEYWLDRPMSKKDKKMIATLIISIFFILNMMISSFRAFNLHCVNFITYYAEFVYHVADDSVKGQKTEFEFIPINIGSFNFGIEDKFSNFKSETVDRYNAEALGDGITKSI